MDQSIAAGRVKTVQVRLVTSDGTAVSVHAVNLGVNGRRLAEFLSVLDRAMA